MMGVMQPGKGYCANLGHQEDETGLVYMRARYYEPGTGRFISEDPVRDGVNWYLYAEGNPVGKVDFTGNSSKEDKLFIQYFGRAGIGAVLYACIQLLFGLLNLHAGGRVGQFIDHVIDAVVTTITAIHQIVNLGRAIGALGTFRGDARVTSVIYACLEGIFATFLILHATAQLRLAYLVLMDPAGHDWAEDHLLFGVLEK